MPIRDDVKFNQAIFSWCHRKRHTKLWHSVGPFAEKSVLFVLKGLQNKVKRKYSAWFCQGDKIRFDYVKFKYVNCSQDYFLQISTDLMPGIKWIYKILHSSNFSRFVRSFCDRICTVRLKELFQVVLFRSMFLQHSTDPWWFGLSLRAQKT